MTPMLVTRKTHENILDESKGKYQGIIARLNKEHGEKIHKLTSEHQRELESLYDLAEIASVRLEQNSLAIKSFSEDLALAKQELEQWQDESGRIIDYNGIILAWEIINKLLQRLDFYYLYDETNYTEQKLELKFTKSKYFQEAREKGERVIEEVKLNTSST